LGERSNFAFVEVTGEPATPQLAEYLGLVEMNFTQSVYPDGYRSEINLAALDWLSIVADRLQRGYVLTIDYGYPASRYYNPRRSQGTLQCYYQHRFHDNPYINIGRQDITAHVDFTALERWGEKCNLKNIGFIQQGLFLMALGLGERIAALSFQKQPLSELLQRRDALHQLIDPTGLGGFGVLVQSKGLNNTETSQLLKGLTLPE
jgi:SAM-dependent MidA family methyltransferase